MHYRETEFGLEVSLSDYHASTLLEQEDFMNFFVKESNAIEGIYDSTHILSFYQDKKSFWKDYPTVVGHREAFSYMMDFFCTGTCTRADILQMHGMLGEYLIHDAGHFRKIPIYIAMHKEGYVRYKGMVYKQQLQRLMTELEADMQTLDCVNVDEQTLWNLHHKFLVFHPFTDGNGRVGRLLLNWHSLRYLDKFMVVTEKNRKRYYSMIEEFDAVFRDKRDDVKFYKDRYKRYISPEERYAMSLLK